MKAIVSRYAGGPETLEFADLPDPAPGPDDILVEVAACGLNFPDLLLIQDLYQQKMARPYIPGSEIAGIVLAVGENVAGIAVGDRIAATSRRGGLAERVLITASRAIRIPDAMPFAEAAAFIVCHGTALYALRTLGRLQEGDTLLVTGASGGVGRAAVELGHALGATVIAAVSSADKAAVARGAGADRTVIYPVTPFDPQTARDLAGVFKEACGPGGANVIFDAVGGAYSEPALRSIAFGGRFLVIGFPAGIARIPLNLAILKGCSIIGAFWGTWREMEPQEDRKLLECIIRMYQDGKIKPLVSRKIPFVDAAQGFAAFSDRSAVGKIVVMMDSAGVAPQTHPVHAWS